MSESPASTSDGWRSIAQIAGLAALYAALGKLALLMAIPPGYATAFWPAAGVALAGTLIFGSRVWPGIFLGSLAANAALSFDSTSLAGIVESIALPAGIAAGATLQAIVGAGLVRRWAGFPSGFDHLGRILGMMLLGGPAACLVSASIGVGSLLMAGSIAPELGLVSWSTWWLGDSIGVLVVIPLASAWSMELRGASRRARLLMSLPMLVSVGIVVVAFLNARAYELRTAQAELERRSEIMTRTLEERVRSKLDLLRSVVSLLQVEGEIDRDEFKAFVEPAFEAHPDLHGLSWNILVSPEDRAGVEESARRSGYPGFRITERNAAGELVTARDRDRYVVVYYIEPYLGNEQALGFDLASDAQRALALFAARDSRRITATAPIALVQETEEKPGFLLFAPVFAPDSAGRLQSFVSGVFRAEAMVEQALAPFASEGIDFDIVDVTDPARATNLYHGDRGPEVQPRDRLGWSTELEVAGRIWWVGFRSSLGETSVTSWSRVWLILTGGLFFTSLLGALLLVTAGRTAMIERANEELRREVGERLRAEEALRKREQERLRAVLEKAALEARVRHAQKLESLGVLAGGIAHDFNNLLVGVLGSADLALGKLEPGHPVLENLRDIETSAQRAAELSNQLLAYSGKGKFVVEAIDLSDLVEGLSSAIESTLSRSVSVRFDLAPGLPALEADASQIQQLVLNLVTNASEAVGTAAGFVAITTGRMDCHDHYLAGVFGAESLAPGSYVFLEVADSGCGMDEETRERIFDPFFTTKFTGRGLGLAAAIGIVRGHGGAIDVRSEPGGGAKIRVLFPAAGTPAAETPAIQGDEEWVARGTVLLAEDEAMIRRVAGRMLAEMGLEVLTATDGVEALEIYRSRAEEIDLVLLDLAMPRLNGDEAFAEIRRIRSDARVILSSGYSEIETRRSFESGGLAGFLQKPYRLDALRDVVREALRGVA